MKSKEAINIIKRIEKRVRKNPFRNYKQAIMFLDNEIQKKWCLSNYKMSFYDYAIIRILKHYGRQLNKKGRKKWKRQQNYRNVGSGIKQ